MDLKKLDGLAFLDSSFPLPLDRPFTTRQAAGEGVTPRQLTWLVANGYLRRPIKGVLLATQAGDSTRLRCEALSLVVPEDCVVCDRHAGWLHGAEMVLAPNEHLDLRPISVFRPAGYGRLRNGLADSGERNLESSEIMELNGLRVTTPIRTAWDLGRVRWTDQAIAGIDAMLGLGVDKNEFLEGIERFKRMRWVTVLRAVGPLGDGRAQSPGESILRLRWIEALLPTPYLQLEVRGDGAVLIAILDIANPDLRYAAEYDGKEWHSSAEQRLHDRLRRDAVRDEGWVVDAFGSENLFGRQQNADARLRAGALAARRKFGSRVA
jgi:hypothetical protein